MPWVDDLVLTLDPRTLRIWKADGTKVADLSSKNIIRWWAYARGGRRLGFVANDAKEAVLFDLAGRRLAALRHDGEVGGMWITAKDRLVVTWSGADRSVRLWDGEGRHQHTLLHPQAVNYALPRPDGRRVFTSTVKQEVRIYDDQGELLRSWKTPEMVTNARWSLSSDRLLTRNRE
ncbi:MAG: WD40 repeat domain-containing protein, partial [Planctomycetota bacterium]